MSKLQPKNTIEKPGRSELIVAPEETAPCTSAAITQATTGEELLTFFQSSPLQGVELNLDNRDKSTGRVATFDD